MVNITIPTVDPIIANHTLNPYVCDCRELLNQTVFVMNARLQYMSILTFVLVVYMATTYKLNESLFKKSIKWCLFILIISTAWLFEFSIRSILLS